MIEVEEYERVININLKFKRLNYKLKQQLEAVNEKLNEYKRRNDILEKALELACKEVPSNHCPDPPERINMQDEYGSDEPYYIYDGGCPYDDGNRCLECCIAHFKQEAKEFFKEDRL